MYFRGNKNTLCYFCQYQAIQGKYAESIKSLDWQNTSQPCIKLLKYTSSNVIFTAILCIICNDPQFPDKYGD